MKNLIKRIVALALLLSTLGLAACDVVHQQGQLPGTEEEGEQGGNQEKPSEQEAPFTVYVRWFNQTYKEYEPYLQDEPLTVQWTNGYDYYTATVGKDSTAQVSGLDGDYTVTLQGLDKSYVYNANAYVATNYKRDIVIDVHRTKEVNTKNGRGSDLYENCITLKDLAVYSVPVKNASNVIYMQFEPTVSGTYSIESWMDVTAAEYNPYIDIYTGQKVGAKYFSYTLDDGGISAGYTQNFKYTVKISDSEIHNVFTFAIRCSSKNDAYPVNVNFAITLDGDFTGRTFPKEIVTPDEELDDTYDHLRTLGAMSYSEFEAYAYEKMNFAPDSHDGRFGTVILPRMHEILGTTAFPDWNAVSERFEIDGEIQNHKTLYDFMMLREKYYTEGVYLNSIAKPGADLAAIDTDYAKGLIYLLIRCRFNASGTLTYCDSAYSINVSGTNRRVFDGSKFKYWAKADGGDGFYHYYDEELYAANGGFGPILYAAISAPTRYTDSPFTTIEAPGNQSLTVGGKYNHKLYIEGFYPLSYYDLSADHSQDTVGPYLCTGDCYCRLSAKCDGACYVGCDRCDSFCRNLDHNGMYALGLADLANYGGYYPVTQSLKDFLQSFCTTQGYFMDGNGWVETNTEYPVYALEDDQWLFACVYYLP